MSATAPGTGLRPASGPAGVARLAALAVLVLGPWVAGGPAAGARPPLAGPGVLSPGSLRDSCRDPVDRTFGVEFRRGELWTLAIDGTLTRLSGCAPAQILSVNGFRGFATGLGWDSRRDLFVVTDAEIESLYVVDLAGEVVRVLGAPGSGSIGAAYDSTRDVYWITDFETDSLYGLNPLDGGRVAAFALPAGSRCAGAAYDPGLDAVFYQDRVLVPTCYFVSAADGSLLGQFQLPYPGLNGWEDNALAPDGSLWAHHFERGKVYAFERSVTSTRRVTWGGLKQRFR